VDIYLDAASSVPLAMDFNIHPDNDAATDISVEIQYSNYQKVSGIYAAQHVQKFLQGGLAVDLNFTASVINSGLTGALFAIPTPPGA
jgi:hypothetical protein